MSVWVCTVGAACALLGTAAWAAGPGGDVALVPQPASVESRAGSFRLPVNVVLAYDAGNDELRRVAEYLAEVLRAQTGLAATVEAAAAPASRGVVRLTAAGADAALGEEGYRLEVGLDGVTIRAPRAYGMFRGVQTLRQLLPASTSAGEREAGRAIPALQIVDAPRFRHRGMLLDCGRHFMPLEVVKRVIDLLAYHKMNVLHWHLTEDQGWRIEIRRYPRLTEIGAWRGKGPRRYGGFYSQADVREVVAYAASRYVTVIPEIELPGHSRAALASYPELGCTGGPYEVAETWGVHDDVYCAGKDETFAFLENLLAEVVELFPGPYVHIGGDECPKTRWQNCPRCQERMRRENLKDEHELQSWFIRRIEKYLNARGKRIIGWDEILEGGLAPNATVQSWRGLDGAIAAARAGHDVISSPTSHCYLDYAQVDRPGEPTFMGFIPLERVYAFEPVPPELSAAEAWHVLGAEGNLWTEHVPPERVDHQAFPRLCALAEVCWSPVAARNWADFQARMRAHSRRLDALGVRYFIAPPQFSHGDYVFTDSLTVGLVPAFLDGVIRYTTDGSEPDAKAPAYEKPLRFEQTTALKARTFLADGRASDAAERVFRKVRPMPAVRAAATAPGLKYDYYEGNWNKLPDFAALTPAASGVTQNVTHAVKRRAECFAIRAEGFLSVPVGGRYTFYLESDDGSRLHIGGEVVIDHDGPHSASERYGQAMLEAGLHAIVIEYFDMGGSNLLRLAWEGPGIARQPVPAGALCSAR